MVVYIPVAEYSPPVSYTHLDRLSQQQYAAGQISYLDVLETQRTLFDAQSDYAETLSATMSSYATLYKALGGGIMSPEEPAEKSAATQ